jgi:type I restriction enzyme S subunit
MTNDMNGRHDLPEGWVWTTIGEICLPPQYGWTTSASSEGKLHLLRTTDITSGHIDWTTVPYCSEEPADKEKYLLHDGDIVISRAGSVGYSHLIKNPQPAVFASYLIRFKPSINGQYVAYFLQSPDYWQAISEQSLGIAIPNVNASKLKQINIPVAPLSEQQHIVTEIEKQFTRLDAGSAALKRAQANLKRYKAAVLKAACEGKLVEQDPGDEPAKELLTRILAERRAKWEADLIAKGKDSKKAKYEEPKAPNIDDLPELPSGWCWATLDQLMYFMTSGSRGWAKYYAESGALFVRVGNFNRLSIALDLQNSTFVDAPQGAEADRTRLQLNDLLITMTADVGMIGIVDERTLQWGEAYINQHVGLVRLVFAELLQFVAWALASESVQVQFLKKQYGATKLGLGFEEVKSIHIPLPPLAEQRRIVAEVERRLSVVQELEGTLAANLARAERLRQAILKRAFEGRLVPHMTGHHENP